MSIVRLWVTISPAQARPAFANDMGNEDAPQAFLSAVAACIVQRAISGNQKKALNSGNAPLTKRS